MAAALIDRLLNHCHIVNIRGNSYRMRKHAGVWKRPDGASSEQPPTLHYLLDVRAMEPADRSPIAERTTQPPERTSAAIPTTAPALPLASLGRWTLRIPFSRTPGAMIERATRAEQDL
jgi:hypothetical protein